MLAITIRIPGLRRIAAALERIADRLPHQHPRIEGAKFVITIKDTQEPVKYSISVDSVLDAKGHPVDASMLDYNVSSSDETIATVVEEAEGEDDSKGTVTFTGEEGPVTINVQVTAKNGTVLGSFFENFQVTAGDPASIVGGKITFEGLSEDAVENPPADPNAPPA